MSTINKATSLNLLISGYLRDNEEQLNLTMNIPAGIDKIIHSLYPILLFKFGDYNSKAFKVTKDGTVIQGADLDCWGYLVYADLGQYSDIGLSTGVHLWSIKGLQRRHLYNHGAYSNFSSCFSSISFENIIC